MQNFYLGELENMDSIELKDIIDELTDFPKNPSYEEDATDAELIRIPGTDVTGGLEPVRAHRFPEPGLFRPHGFDPDRRHPRPRAV